MTEPVKTPRRRQAKRKPITFADTAGNPNNVEKREFRGYGHRSRMGRSSMQVNCPFCQSSMTAYIWSLNGGGKRCPNRNCGALLGRFGEAYRFVAEAVEPAPTDSREVPA